MWMRPEGKGPLTPLVRVTPCRRDAWPHLLPPLLVPHRLATEPDLHTEASLRNRTALGLTGRPPALPAQCLDLTPFYQRPPDAQVLARTQPDAALSEVIRTFEGLPFDLRGALFLVANVTDGNAPARLAAIPVHQRSARLHFLARPQPLLLPPPSGS